jgi:hypothetical protein
MSSEVNDGRGWPMADEPAPVAIAPHRVLLFELVRKALRSEHGVRMRQSQGKKTDYYAGRRAGFIASAALLMEVLYGADYEVAKTTLGKTLRQVSEQFPTSDLIDDAASHALAKGVAEDALRVI